MRILLFNPELPHGGAYTVIGFILPPIGLLYVAECLVQAGHQVDIFDRCTDKDRIIDFSQYDVVGVSADTPRYNYSIKFAQEAKEAGKIVIMGGTHATFEDEVTLKTGYVDYIVRGEGELTTVDLCNQIERLEGKFDPAEILGISYLDQEGELTRTPPRPFIADINDLPLPGRELIDMKKYRILKIKGEPITSLFSSRGCPFRCNFCVSNDMLGPKWRAIDPVKVADEVEMLVKDYGYNAIGFLEDNFTVDTQRVEKICDEFIRRKLDIIWWCTSRSDMLVKNPEMIAKMARSGCDTMFVGIESPNKNMLGELGKSRITADISKEAVILLKKHKIATFAAMMIGGVTETYEDIMNTLKYAIELEPAIAQFSLLTPFPGSEFYEQMKQQNRIKVHNWEVYDCTHATIETDYFKPQELDQILKEVYYKFYGRPYRIVKHTYNFVKGYSMSLGKIKSMIDVVNSEKVCNKL